jgi:hypothetical protein
MDLSSLPSFETLSTWIVSNTGTPSVRLQFSSFVIPQVPGTIPRSTAVRGVLESLVKSKEYALPLVSVAVLHPVFGGSLAFAWLDSSHFNPRRIAEPENSSAEPAAIADELQSNRVVAVAVP